MVAFTHTRASVAAAVDSILAKTLSPDVLVTPLMSIVADLKADSLHMVEIVMGVELAFGIEITNAQLEAIVTVADLHALAIAQLADQGRLAEEAA
jgi:acyl carrier protein